MSAKKLVRDGTRWRVRNGENIRVWGDKWLPTTSTYEVVSLRHFLHADTRVIELINPETTSWKADVIDYLFLPFEADIIKSIPISCRLPTDKQLWAKIVNGNFSVRSAYVAGVRTSRSTTSGETSDKSS